MTSLSVIIPTHNRQRYAADAVAALVKEFPEVEVIVSDTSDSESLLNTFQAMGIADLIVYDRPSTQLNVVANYENGLRLASGDFLIFLGDDDCLGPYAMEVASWAASTGTEAVTCTLPASYGWPDFYSAYFGAGYAATLAVRPYSGAVTQLDATAALCEALDNLGAGPLRMPRAYLGMIARPLATRIVAKYGSLFGGVSPDVYSAALIARESRRTAVLDFPFVLPGSSGASTSGLGASKRHVGPLRTNAHIGAFRDLEWDVFVPEFYSVPTVWSYSLVRAARAIGDGAMQPNFARLYVKCLLSHPGYAGKVWSAASAFARASSIRRLWFATTRALALELAAQGRRVARRVLHPRATGNATAIAGVPSVGEAFRQLRTHVDRIGVKPVLPDV